jgi:hypothetical protein
MFQMRFNRNRGGERVVDWREVVAEIVDPVLRQTLTEMFENIESVKV